MSERLDQVRDVCHGKVLITLTISKGGNSGRLVFGKKRAKNLAKVSKINFIMTFYFAGAEGVEPSGRTLDVPHGFEDHPRKP